MSNLGEVWAATFREEERKPKMKIIAPTSNDVRQWGRMIDSYEGAYGTGDQYGDKERPSINLDGSIWMHHPVESFDIKIIFEENKELAINLREEFEKIDEYESYVMTLAAFKIKPGMFSAPYWSTMIGFLLDRDVNISCGWMKAREILHIFEKYDIWREKQFRLLPSILG